MKQMSRVSLVVFFLVLLIGSSLVGHAQDSPSYQKRLDELEAENKTLLNMIETMQKRLDKMEAKDEAEGEKKSDSKKEKKKKVKKEDSSKESAPGKDEEKKDTEDSSWLPSLKSETFRLGGRFQFEYYNPSDESLLRSAITDNPGGGFRYDELRINIEAKLRDDMLFHAAYDISDDSDLIEAYLDIEELPLSSMFRVGLQKRFFRPSRYTENYPLAGIAFWRSRDLGITWKTEVDPFYGYLSVLNGNTLDTRSLNEDDSAHTISTGHENYDLNGGKEFLAGVGVEFDFDSYGKMDVLGFGLTGDLSKDDVEFLQTEVPGYGFSSSNNRDLIGVNLEYDIGNWDFFAQALTGQDGDIERSAWYAELSYGYKVKGWRYLNSIRPLVRYGELDSDLQPQPYVTGGSLTWDREQWLFGILAEITNNINFRTEYALNEEETGGPDADNDELLFQLEVSF